MKKKLRTGQTVYFEGQSCASDIIQAQIVETTDKDIRLKCISVVDRSGKEIRPASGTVVLSKTQIWTKPQMLHNATGMKRRLKVKKYCEEIKTMEDLLRFPMKHNIKKNTPHYNKEAHRAFIIRAKEIGGVKF